MNAVSAKSRLSAGLLMRRVKAGQLEVFLAHPGGPFFAHKDSGHWSIPKGEPAEGESLLAAAQREFEEETGLAPTGPFVSLGDIRQKGGKIVHAWSFAGDWEAGRELGCNLFRLEWPPRSGQFQEFPEIDRACFFSIPEARRMIKESQRPFLDRLEAALHR